MTVSPCTVAVAADGRRYLEDCTARYDFKAGRSIPDGGSHIVLRVDPASSVEFQLGRTATYLGSLFDDAGVAYGSIVPTDDAAVEVRGVTASASDQTRTILDEAVGKAGGSADPWSVSDLGGGDWRG